MDIIGIIIVGAFAFRGCSTLVHNRIQGNVLSLPLFATTKAGSKLLHIYLYAAIPVALFNGYMINGWSGLAIVGVGTWLGMLLINMLFRFNPIIQFVLFGTVNLMWTFYNIIVFF